MIAVLPLGARQTDGEPPPLQNAPLEDTILAEKAMNARPASADLRDAGGPSNVFNAMANHTILVETLMNVSLVWGILVAGVPCHALNAT
jgi:hypothetical protein